MGSTKKVMVSKRKGRIGGAVLGTVLLGPLGLGLGALIGTRTEHHEVEPKEPGWFEKAKAKEAERIAQGGKPASTWPALIWLLCVLSPVIVWIYQMFH